MQQTTSKPHNGAETALETLDQIENGIETEQATHGNRATARKSYRRHAGSRAFFSTGQAAQELGTSIPKVRVLCETGMIDAELTPGNQWRVPVAEVERLKREGLPPIPRPMPVEDADDFDDAPAPVRVVASRSSAIEAAAEEVAVLRHKAEALVIQKQVEEELDWFRARARKDQAEQAIQAEAERRADEQVRRERERAAWLQGWLEQAMRLIPKDAPGDAAQRVYNAVQEALAGIDAHESARVVEPVVRGVVDRILEPWRVQQRVRGIIMSAAARMPREVQVSGNPWYARAIRAAAEAIQSANATTFEELQARANAAVDPIRAKYEQCEARRRLVDEVARKAGFPVSYDTRLAREAGLAAIITSKPGAPVAELTATATRAIAPFIEQALVEADAKNRARLIDAIALNVRSRFVDRSCKSWQDKR